MKKIKEKNIEYANDLKKQIEERKDKCLREFIEMDEREKKINSTIIHKAKEIAHKPKFIPLNF